MYTALDIAKYFITLANPETEDFITNLKLQKLLYYAQGFHLALFGKPLFRESLEAWQYGPVVPEIYRIYKQYGSSPLPQPDDFNIEQYDRQTQELLDFMKCTDNILPQHSGILSIAKLPGKKLRLIKKFPMS